MSDDFISFEFSQKLVGIQRPLHSFILGLVGHRNDAEDVLQETNLILCKKSKDYDPEGNFQAWAFSIARYQVMAHLTVRRRSRICFSNELVDSLAEEELDAKKLQLLQKTLAICYELLPKSMSKIARLRFKEDKPLKQISLEVKRPVGAISATLFRIRQSLAQCVHLKLPQVEAESES